MFRLRTLISAPKTNLWTFLQEKNQYQWPHGRILIEKKNICRKLYSDFEH